MLDDSQKHIILIMAMHQEAEPIINALHLQSAPHLEDIFLPTLKEQALRIIHYLAI